MTESMPVPGNLNTTVMFLPPDVRLEAPSVGIRLLKNGIPYINRIRDRIVNIDSIPGKDAARKINANGAVHANKLDSDVIIGYYAAREHIVEGMKAGRIILESDAVIPKLAVFHTNHSAIQCGRTDIPAGEGAAAHIDGSRGGKSRAAAADKIQIEQPDS